MTETQLNNLTIDQINDQIRMLQAQKNKMEQPSNGNIIYQYYTVTTNDGESFRKIVGHVCIALERPPKNTPGVQNFRAAFSFRSIEDKYSKSIGRKIATSRLNNSRKKLSISFSENPSDGNDKDYWSKIFRKALDLSLTTKHEGKKNSISREVYFAPDWLRNACESENCQFLIGILD